MLVPEGRRLPFVPKASVSFGCVDLRRFLGPPVRRGRTTGEALAPSLTDLVDSDIPGEAPVFGEGRVPLQNLTDYPEAGDRIDDFLWSFSTVSCEQAVAAPELARVGG